MLRDPSNDLAMLLDWPRQERPMARVLPYISLVNEVTIRTPGNALFQSIWMLIPLCSSSLCRVGSGRVGSGRQRNSGAIGHQSESLASPVFF